MNLKDFLNNKEINERSFGEFIRQRRLELDMKIKTIAVCLQVNSSYVCDIEKGNRHAPITLLKQMIEMLNITEDEEQDFIDLAYVSHNTCAPDLIQYLITNKEALSALRIAIKKGVSGDDLLETIQNIGETYDIN